MCDPCLSNDKPIVVYNCNTKSPIGIFRKKTYVVKYLFTTSRKNRQHQVYEAINQGARINNSELGVPIAIRYANDHYLQVLGTDEVYMLDESLRKFMPNMLMGYRSTAEELRHRAEKIKR